MVRATTLLPEVKPHYGDLTNYVGGAWRPPEATGWLEDTNPATGRAIARVPLSTKDEVDVAVQEALRAWDAWPETPPLDRARHFFTLRDLMERHFEDLSGRRPGHGQDDRRGAGRGPTGHRERRGRRGHPEPHDGLQPGRRGGRRDR